MLRILIVDDNKNKNRWIRDILDKRVIQYKEIGNFMQASSEIKNNSNLYDGIILDMRFPNRMTDFDIEDRAGDKFLDFLNLEKINIPVLGNTMVEFRKATEYELFKGSTYGFWNPKILNEFLESLKDGE